MKLYPGLYRGNKYFQDALTINWLYKSSHSNNLSCQSRIAYSFSIMRSSQATYNHVTLNRNRRHEMPKTRTQLAQLPVKVSTGRKNFEVSSPWKEVRKPIPPTLSTKS